MAHLELFVKFHRGTGRVVAVERDDEAGRDRIDRQAFEWIGRDDVERCEVTRTDRIAGYLKDGR